MPSGTFRDKNYNVKSIKPLPKNKIYPVMLPPITVEKSGFMSYLKEGFSFGIGSSIANRVVDNFLGPKRIEVVHSGSSNKEGKCDSENKLFLECSKNNNGLLNCEKYYSDLQSCLKSG